MASNALTITGQRDLTPMEAHAAYLEEKRATIIAQCVPEDYRTNTAVIDAFLELAKLRGLNPILKQINCIKRGGKPSIETSLDGYRLIASRTGVYAGSDEYVHQGEEAGHPLVSSATVWKFVRGERCPFTASVRWKEFAAYRDGSPVNNWKSMPFHMLGKTAETHALRKAFPEETSGLYTAEEMEQADNAPGASNEAQREPRAAGTPRPEAQRAAPLSAPRVKATITTPPPSSSDEIEWSTEAQVRAIKTIVKESGMTEEAYRALLLERYPNSAHPDTGKPSSTQLTIDEASDLINHLHDLATVVKEATAE